MQKKNSDKNEHELETTCKKNNSSIMKNNFEEVSVNE